MATSIPSQMAVPWEWISSQVPLMKSHPFLVPMEMVPMEQQLQLLMSPLILPLLLLSNPNPGGAPAATVNKAGADGKLTVPTPKLPAGVAMQNDASEATAVDVEKEKAQGGFRRGGTC